MAQPGADLQVVDLFLQAQQQADAAVAVRLHPLLCHDHLALRRHRLDPERARGALAGVQLQHVLAGAGGLRGAADHARLAHARAWTVERLQRGIHGDAAAQLRVAVQAHALVAVHQQRAPVAIGGGVLESGAAIHIGEAMAGVGLVEAARGVLQVHRFQRPLRVVLQQHRRLHLLYADQYLVVLQAQHAGLFAQPQRTGERPVACVVRRIGLQCGDAGTGRARGGQQRAAEADRVDGRVQQLQQGGARVQGRAGAGGQLARGDVLAEEQQQVLALQGFQHVAQVVGHGQVVGGDHHHGVVAELAGADPVHQPRDQPVGAFERIEQADIAVGAAVARALARDRQVPGRMVGIHGQRGEHERLAGTRQLDEAVEGAFQQHVVVDAPVGEVPGGDALLVEPRQVANVVVTVAGEKIGLRRELTVGAAHVVVAVALLSQIVAQAECFRQEAAHAAHAVLVTLRGGQRHPAHG